MKNQTSNPQNNAGVSPSLDVGPPSGPSLVPPQYPKKTPPEGPRRAAGGNLLKTSRQMDKEFKNWSDSHYEAVMAPREPTQLELFE